MSDELYDDFGDPEGQRDVARTEDVLSELFVETDSTSVFLDSTPEHHVVFGPKGSGKSLLLFRKAVQVRQKPGVIVAPTNTHAYVPTFVFGSAEKWAPYWPLQRAEGGARRADWAGLWAWALATTVLLRWKEHAAGDEDLRGFLRDVESPLNGIAEDNPYHLVSSELYEMASSTRRSRGNPILPKGESLNRILAKYANAFPPTYIFLDNQDETYEENPEFWMSSGYGCFLAIRELHTITAHRVHVFMTLRAEVVGELRKSEHFSKWTRDLFQIGWRDQDLLRVFDSRAARLKTRNLPGANLEGMSALVRFLGPSFLSDREKRVVIRIPRAERIGRRVFLPFDQYLLRHSLRRPRDLIVLGNKIIEARRMAATDGRDEVQLVREAVDRAASEVIAEGYLAEISDRWPWTSHPGGGIKEFFSRHIRKNILSLRETAAIEHEYARELMLPKVEVRPFRELGRLGIVGWPVQNAHSQRGEIQYFARPGDTTRVEIPGSAKYALIHPVFCGPPFHVASVPGVLLGPGLPFSYRQLRRYDSCVIVYARCDEGIALSLYDRLAHEGVECWLHIDESSLGEDSRSVIHRHMDLGDRVVCLCSTEAFLRPGFTEEVLRQAADNPGKLLAIGLDREWMNPTPGEFQTATEAREALRHGHPIALWNLGVESAIGRVLAAIRRATPKGRKRGGPPAGTRRVKAKSDPPETETYHSDGGRPPVRANPNGDGVSIALVAGVEVVPGYFLEAHIGRGGFGEVWKAVGPGEVHVALKILRIADGSAAQEAKALEFMKFVKHPHLLAIFGVWHRRDLLVIGMELADRTLMQCLTGIPGQDERGIPFHELIEYMREAAKAIDYLNEPSHTISGKSRTSIVHRDIKPQNMLLIGRGVKVADYGLAQALRRTGSARSGGITPAYAAPEFFRGETYQQSDQYSFAVSYCQLRTGSLPFAGELEEVMAGHLSGTPDLAPLPKPERRVVARALAKKPADRWATCQRFVRELAVCQKKWPYRVAMRAD